MLLSVPQPRLLSYIQAMKITSTGPPKGTAADNIQLTFSFVLIDNASVWLKCSLAIFIASSSTSTSTTATSGCENRARLSSISPTWRDFRPMQEKDPAKNVCLCTRRCVCLCPCFCKTQPTPSGVLLCHGTDSVGVTPIFTRPPSPPSAGWRVWEVLELAKI